MDYVLREDKFGEKTTIRIYANIDDPIEKAIGRQCSNCGNINLRSELKIVKTNRDKMYAYCNPCSSKKTAAAHKKRRGSDPLWAAEQSKKNVEYDRKKKIENPEYANKRNQQNLNRHYKRMSEDINYAKHKSRKTCEWYKNNPDKAREYNHQRRARIEANGGTFTNQEWIEVKAYFDNTCPLTGHIDQLTLEHMIPISYGGANDSTNIIPLYGPTNCSKNNSNPFNWIETQPLEYHEGFNRVVAFLADQNEMSVDEYKEYVDSFFARRSVVS